MMALQSSDGLKIKEDPMQKIREPLSVPKKRYQFRGPLSHE